MISKPRFFTVILMNLTLVLMWLRDEMGEGGNTKYGRVFLAYALH